MGWFGKKKKEVAKGPPPDPAAVAARVRGFVAGRTKLLGEEELTDDRPLFSAGVLDSLSFVDLVLLVESEYDVTLADVIEVTPEHLDSIAQITAAVVNAHQARA